MHRDVVEIAIWNNNKALLTYVAVEQDGGDHEDYLGSWWITLVLIAEGQTAFNWTNANPFPL